ncbi:MAG: hypothetical protein AAF270_05820 [Pseudomonadota bacterium]
MQDQQANQQQTANPVSDVNASDPAPRKALSKMKKYRRTYTKSESANGNPTQHSGDDIAILLAGCTPQEVMQAADLLLGTDIGTIEARYAHLNPGHARMSTGNAIRRLVRDGTLSVDDVADALARV